MGWNNWYTFYEKPSDALMRKAADIMIQSGMADHGYQYVNIDDAGWGGRSRRIPTSRARRGTSAA